MKNTKTKATLAQDIVFGIHPLIELLTAKKRHVYTIYTTQLAPKAWGQIERLIPKDTVVKRVSKEHLDKLTDSDDHQNVVALVKPLQMRASCFDPKKHPFIVLLDSIQDTRNMGAIMRSAYCTGANGMIIPEKNSAPLSGATYKASAGLAEHLDIYRPGSTHQAVLELKKAGYHVYMAALGGKNALEIDYKLPLCLVIGNESTGIASEILKMGEKVTLPQRTPNISYNASVAAGILLFTIGTKSGALT
jgi:23S rRNA (guanosine2251-2'-O)-methyltransferase